MKRVFSCLFLAVTCGSPTTWADAKRITVIFRYDDYCTKTPTEFEVRLIRSFESRGLSCTFGVVPFVCEGKGHHLGRQEVLPLSQPKVAILKKAIQAGTVDVALHGYSHQTVSKWLLSEFNGLDYTSQALRVDVGRRFLEEVLEVRIESFIPPWDSFDSTTISVLEDQGFDRFSANINAPNDVDPTCRMKFLPATCDLSNLKLSVESARRVVDHEPIIVVLFHCYDFLEVGRPRGWLSYSKFDDLLDWLTAQNDVTILSMDQAAKTASDLSADRLVNFTDRFILRLVPPFLRRVFEFPVGVYYSSLSTSRAVGLWASCVFYYAIIVLLCGVAAFIGGAWVFPRSKFLKVVSKYGGVTLLILFLVYDLRNFVVVHGGALVIACLFGACCGLWSVRQRERDSDQVSQHSPAHYLVTESEQ